MLLKISDHRKFTFNYADCLTHAHSSVLTVGHWPNVMLGFPLDGSVGSSQKWPLFISGMYLVSL